MSDLIERAQARIRERRKTLGINGELPFRKPTTGREWAEHRIQEWKAKGKLGEAPVVVQGRGRHVRCVECGHEQRVETNRNRRLRSLSCEEAADRLDGVWRVCGGRLRPLNWFLEGEHG